MTNPDNVGGLPELPFSPYIVSEWANREMTERKSWTAYSEDQMRAIREESFKAGMKFCRDNELCHAAPAGEFAGKRFTEVRIPQGYALDVAQAGVLAIVPQAAPSGGDLIGFAQAGSSVRTVRDSAPAGSWEVAPVEFATVRDGDDEWHIECRFKDGQKYAAVTVDREQEELAHRICDFLNSTFEAEVEDLAKWHDSQAKAASWSVPTSQAIPSEVRFHERAAALLRKLQQGAE